ncbi:MAG: ABC transporter substrate-binding protein [Minwuia sp.]|uniref:ABC transporter substrate-binding protein n=1 Tax=Minwuia sp. TaxID=2493630 RepID=UPI003A8B2C27
MTLVFLAIVLGMLLPAIALAETVLTIGHVQLKKDRSYGKSRSFAQYLMQPLGRPWDGAQVALGEVKWHGAAAGVSFALERARTDPDSIAATVREMAGQGVRFFVLDLPGDVMAEAAAALKGEDVLLFNASARDDVLRGAACQPNLLHVMPSHAMLADALGQYLAFKRWTEVLMLTGPSDADRAWADAFRRTAKRYNIEIDEDRAFVLSNDPRLREENNPVLLTSDADYDVVFVADTDGEFARNLNYRVRDPRPVIGAEGLAPLAWHWAWERHGAPQLESRFQEEAGQPDARCRLGGLDGGQDRGRGGAAHGQRRLRHAERLHQGPGPRAGRLQGQPAELPSLERAVAPAGAAGHPQLGGRACAHRRLPARDRQS